MSIGSNDPTQVQRRRCVGGGSIKKLIVAKKGVMIVHPLRRVGSKVHKEVIYKKNTKTSEKVVDWVQATYATHGFYGYIGRCIGHPDLLPSPALLSTQASLTMSPTPPDCPHNLAQWFFQTAKPGMTKADLLRDLQISPEVENREPYREPCQLTRRMSDSSLSENVERVRNSGK
jgi:hypothetical protein